MFTHPIAIIKKFKLQYLKKNLNVRIFELSENVKMKKVHETVYACSYGAQVDLRQNKFSKIS